MVFDEKITVSPSPSDIWGWVSIINRCNAAPISPCVPVATASTSPSGRYPKCSASMIGTLGSNTPAFLAERTIMSSDRPMSPTRRSDACAARKILCTRATLLAKQATTTRPFSDVINFTSASPTSPSVGERPGFVAFVESHMTASTPLSPIAFH